jgi:predicted ferric reductase
MQRHVTIPAMFGYRASQPFGWYTVPPRLQSLTIFSFVIMNIFLCAHGYRVFQDNLYFPEVHTQAWRYVSDRTGIISFANFPLIWLFGIRNNLLLWLTGWSFGTYNNFHRWVARVATVQAVVHSIGYTVLVFDSGGWPLFIDYWKQFWWTTGELATISMCALIPLSIYYMRRNVYELFLLIHIALSITILATMWGHVSIFKGHYEGLVWVCCAIWMLDRISRVIRTLAFNRLFWTTRARATYDSSANIVRLSIPYRNSLYRPKPGTFYYLQLLSDYRFWESHPFTMAGIQSQDDTKAAEAVAQQSILIHETASLLSRPDPSASLSALQVSESCMTFLVRPYDSFTSRLRDAASHSYPHPTYLPILVEGPYGDSQPLHRYQQTIFMVGGSGIVVPLVHLERLCKDNTTTRSIHITWAAREPAFIESCLQQDFGNFQDAFDSGKLFMDIFITGLYDSSKWQGLPKAIQLFQGRPTVKGQIQDFLEDYGSRATTAVVSCGPSSMNDDVRKAVTDILGDERYSIEFFQESFNW